MYKYIKHKAKKESGPKRKEQKETYMKKSKEKRNAKPKK